MGSPPRRPGRRRRARRCGWCRPVSSNWSASASRSRSRAAGRRWAGSVPYPPPFGRARDRELHHHVESPHEGRVDVLGQVGGEQGHALVALEPLQEVGHLDVGVAVVGVGDLGALAQERVGLVEEERDVRRFGGVEESTEVLLRLADVLLTRLARSTLYRSTPRSAAMISAARVLPVPDGPASRRDHPGRRRRRRSPTPEDRSRGAGSRRANPGAGRGARDRGRGPPRCGWGRMRTADVVEVPGGQPPDRPGDVTPEGLGGPTDLVELFGAEGVVRGTAGAEGRRPLLGRGPASPTVSSHHGRRGRSASGRSDGLVMAQARCVARSTRSRASAANGPVSSSTTPASASVAWRTTASHGTRTSGGGSRGGRGGQAVRHRLQSPEPVGPGRHDHRSVPVPGPATTRPRPAGRVGPPVAGQPPQHGGRDRQRDRGPRAVGRGCQQRGPARGRRRAHGHEGLGAGRTAGAGSRA